MEILEKYTDVENSYLTKEEKEELMHKLYSKKETFSLRNEIGTYPNIEVEIYVVDKPLILYWSTSCKGRGQTDTGQRNEMTVSSWYIKGKCFGIPLSGYVNK